MANPDNVPRQAGRVLAIDPRGRVLLLFGFDPADPAHPFWFTVADGAGPGESLAEAAARELREEVGIAADPAALQPGSLDQVLEVSLAGRRDKPRGRAAPRGQGSGR